jgi:hypothetical protein
MIFLAEEFRQSRNVVLSGKILIGGTRNSVDF